MICDPTRYQLDHKGAHRFGRTRVINTVQSRAYSRCGFSAINSIVIRADMNVETKVGSSYEATPLVIYVDDVSILAEEGLEVRQAAPDCKAGGNTR